MEICNQYALPAARLTRKPIVTHRRNMSGQRAFNRMFLGFADVLIANSRAVADAYHSWLGRGQRAEVIYNAVDPEMFSPKYKGKSLRRNWGLTAVDYVIGVVGRLHHAKGQDVFVRALHKVCSSHECDSMNIYGLIVGDTRIDDSADSLDYLQSLVHELRLDGRVIFTGFVEDIVNLYASLDLLVLPTLAEGFGRTVAEAMAMEKPLVASRVGGLVEIVADDTTGQLVPPGDVDALAEAILKLIKTPQLASDLGIKGRRRIEEHFNIEKNVRATEQVYKSLLGVRFV